MALGKPATQSSDYSDSSGAEKAVDGKAFSNSGSNTCARTKGDNLDPYPWWRVDLQQSFKVHKVCSVCIGVYETSK